MNDKEFERWSKGIQSVMNIKDEAYVDRCYEELMEYFEFRQDNPNIEEFMQDHEEPYSSNGSLFMDRRFKDYMKCPITKPKLPTSTTEKIQLEPFDSAFIQAFLPDKPLTCIIETPRGMRILIRRIVGYREIFKKRRRMEYLLALQEQSQIGIQMPIDPLDAHGEMYFEHPLVAKGGGEDDKEKPKKSKKRHKEKHRDKSDKKEPHEHGHHHKKHDGKDGGKGKDKAAPGAPKNILERVINYFKDMTGIRKKAVGPAANATQAHTHAHTHGHGHGERKSIVAPHSHHTHGRKSEPGGEHGRKSILGGRKSIANNKPPAKPSFWTRLFRRIKNKVTPVGGDAKGKAGDTGATTGKKRKKKPKTWFQILMQLFKKPSDDDSDEEHAQTIFAKGGDDVQLDDKFDSHWLSLSDTDEEQKEDEIDAFYKPLKPWMIEGVSYESQNLAASLNIYRRCAAILGRSFFYIKKNYDSQLMECITSPFNLVIFLLSSLAIWMAQCLIIVSILDLQSTNDSTDVELLVESQEYDNLKIPLSGFMANLLLIALWSCVMILKDALAMTHYFNCWASALTEMENSATLSFKRYMRANIMIYIVFVTFMTTGFVFDWPRQVRGLSGLLSVLIFRGFVPNLRQQSYFFYFQVVGFVFYLYVMFATRMLFTLMQLLASMLKHASEMWNFKFALTFGQLVTQERGQLYHLKLNLSLRKVFNHHRILVSLLKTYNAIFGIPIITYILTQMTIVTTTLVWLFNFKEDSIDNHENKTVLAHNPATKEKFGVNIPLFYTLEENLLTGFFNLGQVLFEFIYTTMIIASSGESFLDGNEFVRRQGMILCETSHQRRLIQSLEWSMSAASVYQMTADNFFAIDRPVILTSIGTALFFFSLIIQLQIRRGSQTFTSRRRIRPIQRVTAAPIIGDKRFIIFLIEQCQTPRKYLTNPLENVYFCHIRENPKKLDIFRKIVAEDQAELLEILKEYHKNWRLRVPREESIEGDTKECLLKHKGLNKEKCEWREFYRDCYRECNSKTRDANGILLKRNVKISLPILYLQRQDGQLYLPDGFLPENKDNYDCNINPYTFDTQDINNKVTKIFNCLGQEVKAYDWDDCGWYSRIYPVIGNVSAILDLKKYDRIEFGFPLYDFSKNNPRRDNTQCYNHPLNAARCDKGEFCALSKLRGTIADSYGAWYGRDCYKFASKPPDITGFCKHLVFDEYNAVGMTLSSEKVEAAEKTWKPTYNVGNLAPDSFQCTADWVNDFQWDAYWTLQHKYAFEFVCNSSDTSYGVDLVRNYRPFIRYKISPDDDKNIITQLPIDELLENYEEGQDCTKDPYPPLPLTLKNGVVVREYHGCRGRTLFKNLDQTICKSKILNGYCEAESQTYYYLWDDCGKEPTVKKYTIKVHEDGVCETVVPSGIQIKNNPRLTIEEYNEISSEQDGWNRKPWTVKEKEPNNTVFPGWGYCGYFQNDCLFKVYLRDCFTSAHSEILNRTILLPVMLDKKSGKVLTGSRFGKIDPAFDVVFGHPNDRALLNFCGANVPFRGFDNCGWPQIPYEYGKLEIIKTTPVDIELRNKNGTKYTKQIQCVDLTFAIERCKNPKIAPYCSKFIEWKSIDGDFVEGVTYGPDCFTETSESPDPFHGFCHKAYVPFNKLKTDQRYMTVSSFKRQSVVQYEPFDQPPCRNPFFFYQQLGLDASTKEQLFNKLFLQFICPNELNYPVAVNHWPLYKDSMGTIRFVPNDVIQKHLNQTDSCIDNPYPEVSQDNPWVFTQKTFNQPYDPEFPLPDVDLKTVEIKQILGCHGLPLHRATSDLGCTGEWLNGYCEVDTLTSYILTEDYEALKQKDAELAETCQELDSTDQAKPYEPLFKRCLVLNTILQSPTSNFPYRKWSTNEFKLLIKTWRQRGTQLPREFSCFNTEESTRFKGRDPPVLTIQNAEQSDCDYKKYYLYCIHPCLSRVLGKLLLLPAIYQAQGADYIRYQRSKIDGDCAYTPFTHAYLNINLDFYTCYGELIEPYENLENSTGIVSPFCGWVQYAEIQPPDYKTYDLPGIYDRPIDKENRPHYIIPNSKTGYFCVNTKVAIELCTSPETWKNCRKAKWAGERVKVYYYGDKEGGCLSLELAAGTEPINEDGFCESLHPQPRLEIDRELLVTTEEYEKRLEVWDELIPLRDVESGTFDCLSTRKILRDLYYFFPCLGKQNEVKANNFRLYYDLEVNGVSYIKQIPMDAIRDYTDYFYNFPRGQSPIPPERCYEQTTRTTTIFGFDRGGVLPYPPLLNITRDDAFPFNFTDTVNGGTVVEDYTPPYYLTCRGLFIKRFFRYPSLHNDKSEHFNCTDEIITHEDDETNIYNYHCEVDETQCDLPVEGVSRRNPEFVNMYGC